jgi:hypothetical protein
MKNAAFVSTKQYSKNREVASSIVRTGIKLFLLKRVVPKDWGVYLQLIK